MDKNTIIGLVLIFAILIGSSYFFKPSKESLRKQDSLKAVHQISDSISKNDIKTLAIDSSVNHSSQIASTQKKDTSIVKKDTKTVLNNYSEVYGVFSLSARGEQKYFYIENDNFILTISSKGGRIISVLLKHFLTWDKKPVILFDEKHSNFGFTFTSGNRVIYTDDLFFEPFANYNIIDTIKVKGMDSLNFAMRLYPDANDSIKDSLKYIEFSYNIKGDKYLLDFTASFNNMGGIIPNNIGYLNLDWKAKLKRQEKNREAEKNATTIYYKYYDGDVDYLSETRDKNEKLSTPVHWISFKQQFFASTIIAKTNFITNADISVTSEPNTSQEYLRNMNASMDMAFNAQENKQVYDFNLYFGPNKYKTLRKLDLDLERQIPLGWSFRPLSWINQFIVIPVFNLLEGFNIHYGIIILILTILLKIILFPIAYRTYMSSAKMRVLKPEIDEINKRYPKPEDAMKKQQAIMNLYKKAGVNPMSGCIPLLLQMPILIAFYRFFPASIELRQQKFLWATDLSSYDSILNLPFNIPLYGDHVSLFCLLMTISTLVYTKINNDMMAGSQQMPGMKAMSYIMPIMFLGIFNNFAAGLNYYYLLANLFTFIQMFAFRKFINEDKIHKKIQENRAKPVKKSNFQKRLEELAKQQQVKR